MTKKPRKKKNSNIKRLTLTSRRALKGVGIGFVLNEKSTFIELKTKRTMLATQAMITAAQGVQHNWKIYIVVFLENQIGEKYAAIEEVIPERACYQECMINELNAAHIKLIGSTKKADRVNAGWLAMPNGEDLEESQIIETLELLKPWGQYERGEIRAQKERDAA